MPLSIVYRWSIPRASFARCRSKGCMSAPTPIRTMSSSCSGKLRLSSVCLLGRSGELAPGGPPLPNTMLGNSASYEVGKSYTPLFQEWERHLSHQGRLDELFLLFSDSKKAGEDQRHHEGSSQHKISEMPNSRATCTIDFPLVWASCTASRLNSAVEIFCPFCMILVLLLEESLRRFYPSTNSGQDQIPLMEWWKFQSCSPVPPCCSSLTSTVILCLPPAIAQITT